MANINQDYVDRLHNKQKDKSTNTNTQDEQREKAIQDMLKKRFEEEGGQGFSYVDKTTGTTYEVSPDTTQQTKQVTQKLEIPKPEMSKEQEIAMQKLSKSYEDTKQSIDSSRLKQEQSIQPSTISERIRTKIEQKTGVTIPTAKEVYSRTFQSNQEPYEQKQKLTIKRVSEDVGESAAKIIKISSKIVGEGAYKSRESIPYKAKEITIEGTYLPYQQKGTMEGYQGTKEFIRTSQKTESKTYEPLSSETFRKGGEFVGFSAGYIAVEKTIGTPVLAISLLSATTTTRKISNEERLEYAMLGATAGLSWLGSKAIKIPSKIPRKSLGGLTKEELKTLARVEPGSQEYYALKLKALKGYEKQGDMIGATAFNRVFPSTPGKVTNMIAKSEQAISKAGINRLERLKALDRGSAKLGLNVPSAYEEAIESKFTYIGQGTKELSNKQYQVLLSKLPEEKIKLYHGTTESSAKVIKEKGAKDLYLTPEREYAEGFAGRAVSKGGFVEKPEILEVQVPASKYKELIKVRETGKGGTSEVIMDVKPKYLKEDIGSDIILSKEKASKSLKDFGLYKQEYTVLPPKKITIYEGITESGKPAWTKEIELEPLKYTERNLPKGTNFALVGTKKTPGYTIGAGISFERGSSGIINKKAFTLVEGEGITKFNIYGTGRKSVQTKELGVKKYIYPEARLEEVQLAKSKMLSIKKEGNQIIRDYETKYTETFTKPRRVSTLDILQDLTNKPTKKEFGSSFKTSKELTRDIITKKPKEISIEFKGEVNTLGEQAVGKSITEIKISEPYTQVGYGRKLSPGEIVTNSKKSKFIIPSGKKSSPEYFQSLYKEQIEVQVPRPKVNIKPIKSTQVPEITLGSESFSPLMVGGEGAVESIYAGSRGAVSRVVEDITYIPQPKIQLGTSNNLVIKQETDISIKPKTEIQIKSNIQEKDIIKTNIQQPNLIKELTKTNMLQPNSLRENIITQEREQQLFQPKEKQDIKEIQLVKELQKQIQPLKTRNILKTKTITKLRNPPKEPPRIKIPITIPSLGRALKKVSKMEDSEFEAVGIRFGKEVSLGKGTKKESEQELYKFLSGTLGASGFLKKGETKLKAEDIGILSNFNFRKSKVSPYLVVEKKEKRLKRGGTEVREINYFKRR